MRSSDIPRRARPAFTSRVAIIALALVAPTVSTFAMPAAPPTFEERLQTLIEKLEEARQEQHIPGMALAVVKDDEVVLAHGFGLADIESKRPVTPETIFAIGSTTKAFTANLIAMLIDEGVMSWDDPLSKHLPYFTPQLDSDDEGAQILIRDALCHRSGFTRMSLLFAGGAVEREEILRTANNAEPWAPYGEQFLYNNVMYMAAGMCAGEAAGSSWEELMRRRIFEPLGMRDSTLTIAEAHADPRLSLGYQWKTQEEQWKRLPMRNIDQIGPAGSINSNVLDVAKWIRFQLGRGAFDGTRLLSEERHRETWTPQIAIAPGIIDYGFGWMIRTWNEKQVIEHGGNIDGFAAQIALLPEENLGFVLLCNVSFTPLQSESIEMVFDTLAGEWEDPAAAVPSEGPAEGGDLAAYEGVYTANYAHFEDEPFTVSVNDDGALQIDIPSQRVYALEPPGEDGRRAFAGFPGIAADFERDDESGEVVILRLYQNGLRFDVPREGYEYPVEIPLAELAKYCGRYRFDLMNHDVAVLIRNNHLAVDVPGQMVFELLPPDDEGRRVFRNSDVMTLALRFNEGEYGEVESMTLFQMGQEHTLPRIAGAEAGDLPTLEELFALCRLDERQRALEQAEVIELAGEARFVHSGVVGEFTQIFDADDRVRADIDLGRFGAIRSAVNTEGAWVDVSFSPFEELSGEALEIARREHPSNYLGDWRRAFDEIRIDAAGEVDGRATIVVKAREGDSPTVTMHIDRESGDILRMEAVQEIPDLPVRLPVTWDFSRWREINGLRLPFESSMENQANGRMEVQILRVRTSAEVADGIFRLQRRAEN